MKVAVVVFLLSFAIDSCSARNPAKKIPKVRKGGGISVQMRILQDEDSISNDGDNIFSHDKKGCKGKGKICTPPTMQPSIPSSTSSAPTASNTVMPSSTPTVSELEDESGNGLLAQKSAHATSGSSVMRSILTAMGGLCFFIVSVMTIQYRRKRQEGHLKLDESQTDNSNSSLAFDDDKWVESLSSKVQLILGKGLLGDDEQSLDSLDRLAMNDNRDVHVCTSSTCPVCCAIQGKPYLFKHSNQDEGGWHHSLDESFRSYSSPNTVYF